MLSQSSNQFKLAINKFEESKAVLKSISEPAYKSKNTLIPITNSLYVEGFLIFFSSFFYLYHSKNN